MVDPERSGQALRALHALGVVLSIDDYGTWYGSLACLQELPVSRLKIDRSFVAGPRDSDASKAIVRSVVELAQRLGLSVVAEGVEDDETFLVLRDMHCDFAQGYGIARPLPAERLIDVTRRVRARMPALLGLVPPASVEVPPPRAEAHGMPVATRPVSGADGTVPGRRSKATPDDA
jgi:EAL domain-containing protein (putative c-di-GMP-specific phosphodiesterase class I)